MSRGGEGGGAVDEAVRAASEALTLEDLNAIAVPMVERALGTHLTAVVQFDQQGRPEFKAGNVGRCAPQIYFEHYFLDDPVTAANRRFNRKIFITDRDFERREFEASEAYSDYYRSRDIGRILCCRMITSSYYVPGSAMIGFFRARSQPSFTERDARMLGRMLPAFEAAAKRSQRLEQHLRAAAAKGALLDRAEQRPRFALDGAGHLLWMSKPAAAVLRGADPLPKPLMEAAHRLAAFAEGEGSGDELSFSLPVAVSRERTLQVDLHVERSESGEPFVVGEVHEDVSRTLGDFAREFGLTATEMIVLHELSQGRSNEEIQKQLNISMSTVKTHVHRILQKLGVSSRLQAALLHEQHCSRALRR